MNASNDVLHKLFITQYIKSSDIYSFVGIVSRLIDELSILPILKTIWTVLALFFHI